MAGFNWSYFPSSCLDLYIVLDTNEEEEDII